MTTTIHRAAVAAALLLFAPALGACGSDDQGANAKPTPTTTAPQAEDPANAADPAFCAAFTEVDAAFKDAPEDPAELEAFVAQEVTPNIEAIRANLPAPVADEVTTLADTVEQIVETGNFDLLGEDPFATASAAVYASMDDLCGLPVVEVGMIDYSFDGLPEAVDAGLTSLVVHNESQAGEYHQIELVKLADGVELTPKEVFATPEPEVNELLETFGGSAGAAAGLGGGTLVDLTPGRWVYACFIPVGSVGGAEGTGHAHWEEGMFGEIQVA